MIVNMLLGSEPFVQLGHNDEIICILYRKIEGIVVFWPSTRSNMPLQSDAPEGSDTFQWPVIERSDFFRLLAIGMCHFLPVQKLADEMGQGKKSHDTLIDWCIGREWPLNCMAVIYAWWRSNVPFQRLSGRLSGRWTQSRQKVSQLELEMRCGRKSHARGKGPLGPPSELGSREVADKMW